jgi:putative endonuclease
MWMQRKMVELKSMRNDPGVSSYYVYVVECSDATLYVGCTNDLVRRLREHNTSKKGARYTKARRPVTFKYSEAFATKGEALRREGEIKTWTREKKLKLLSHHNSSQGAVFNF